MELHGEIKITDLSIECLQKICHLLDLEDLLNFTDSNKTFKKATESIYAEYYGKKKMCIYGLLPISYPSSFHSDKWFNFVYTTSFKKTLQLLRCFGHLITKLDISLCGRRKTLFTGFTRNTLQGYFDHLIAYINDFCSFSSLNELSITGEPGGAFQTLVKPFVNVESVCVQPSDVENISLAELFPNMQRLAVYLRETTYDISNVEQYFPNVQHLEIIGKNSDELKIPFNSDLTSLELPFTTNGTVMQSISNNLPNLQNLRINYIDELFHFDDNITVHFKNVKKLDIKLDRYYLKKIPFSFHQLKELTLTSGYNSTNSEVNKNDFYRFIRENSSIQKLKILSPEKVDLFQLTSSLQLLREVQVECEFSIDEITSFLNQNKTLEKCSFELCRDNIIVDLKASLHNDWKISMPNPRFTHEIECVRI